MNYPVQEQFSGSVGAMVGSLASMANTIANAVDTKDERSIYGKYKKIIQLVESYRNQVVDENEHQKVNLILSDMRLKITQEDMQLFIEDRINALKKSRNLALSVAGGALALSFFTGH